MNVQRVLRDILDATGWTHAELADRLGVNQPDVSRWLAGREPKGRNWEAIRALALEQRLILPDGIGRADLVPIVGRVGAGGDADAEMEQPPPEGYDQVEIAQLTTGRLLCAFEVVGESMSGLYEPGEIILVYAEQRRNIEWFLGRVAVFRTADKKRWLKKLTLSRRPGLYIMSSANADPMETSEIEWAGEIYASFKPDSVRKLPRAKA